MRDKVKISEKGDQNKKTEELLSQTMHNAIQELRGMASEELITIAMLSTYSFKLQLAVVPSQQTNSSSV